MFVFPFPTATQAAASQSAVKLPVLRSTAAGTPKVGPAAASDAAGSGPSNQTTQPPTRTPPHTPAGGGALRQRSREDLDPPPGHLLPAAPTPTKHRGGGGGGNGDRRSSCGDGGRRRRRRRRRRTSRMKVDVLAGFLVEGRCVWVGGFFEFNVKFVFGRGGATLSGPVGPRAQSARFGGRSHSSDLGAAHRRPGLQFAAIVKIRAVCRLTVTISGSTGPAGGPATGMCSCIQIIIIISILDWKS